ncbi:MAG: hypothetical protein M1814_006731 [Vezdaea aestivalis]|nr:MAG: hypothetical protein M1814_006731 [Vezdaea aestivalis]
MSYQTPHSSASRLPDQSYLAADRPSEMRSHHGNRDSYYNSSSDFSSPSSAAYNAALSHATSEQQGPSSEEDQGLFGHALNMLGKHGCAEVDEEEGVQAHQAMYSGGGAQQQQQQQQQQASSETVGAGAAVQALKMFTGGGHGGGGQGQGQGQFVGMAMAQASKLFDRQSEQGNVQSDARKEDAVAHAAKVALGMYLKGGGGGGAGGLAGLAGRLF